VPFLLETALRERGARYSKAALWQPHIVVSGKLVTGQNPASATGVGRAVAELLAK
jgi:putative intracellular protease/amidase